MKNKKLFVKYKISQKVIQTVTLLSVVFLMIFGVIFSGKVYAQETTQSQQSLLYRIIKVLFNGEASISSSSSNITNNNTSNTDITILPPQRSDDILGWAQLISSKLEPGRACGGWFCRMVSTITNGTYTAASRQGFNDSVTNSGRYWCTRLMIDSANLAGRRGLSTQHEGVINMIAFWQANRASGYNFFSYDGSSPSSKKSYLTNLKPGCAFFQVSQVGVHTGYEHVAVVKTITINSSGDGSITTLDANSSQKQHTFPVSDWQVKNTFYPHVNFGCFN